MNNFRFKCFTSKKFYSMMTDRVNTPSAGALDLPLTWRDKDA